MPRSLKLYIAGVVVSERIGARGRDFCVSAEPAIALDYRRSPASRSDWRSLLASLFWTVLTLIASALPGSAAARHAAGCIDGADLAAMFSGRARGRRLGRRYRHDRAPRTSRTNSLVRDPRQPCRPGDASRSWRESSARSCSASALGIWPVADFVSAMVAAAVFLVLNVWLAYRRSWPSDGPVRRDGLRRRHPGDRRQHDLPWRRCRWLMAVVYAVQWWATALFAVPLYSTRLAYQRFIEMREMFTQTIGALAEAVDKRDPFTAKHSRTGEGDRGRYRAGHARQRLRARGARVGRPAP